MATQITIKHGKETLQLDWSLDRPVAELQERLEELTGLMVRTGDAMCRGGATATKTATASAARAAANFPAGDGNNCLLCSAPSLGLS